MYRTALRSALLLVTVLAIAATTPVVAVARDADGGLPGDWLSEFTSSRSIGLGGAYVARGMDPFASVWNPAGITELEQNELRAESMRLFDDTSINSIGFAVPAKRLPSIGFTMLALRSGEFQKTNELNESIGAFQEGDTAFLMTLAKRLTPRVSLGANLKFVHQSIDEWSATGFGVDFGAQAQLTSKLRVGASLLNIGGPSLTLREQQDDFPAEFRGGLSLALLNGRARLSTEINRRGDLSPILRGGAQFWVTRNVALRAGYDYDNPAGGFTYRAPNGVDFDYGVTDNEFGVIHQFGLSYRFGGFFAQSVASPEVFSPTGRKATTQFDLRSRTRGSAVNWTLEITDKSGNLVRNFGGKQLPPQQITWDGKDQTGLPLPDGLYTYELRVVDDEGTELISRTRQIEILTSGPSGAVPVIIEE